MNKARKEKFYLGQSDDVLPRFPIRVSELDRFKFGKFQYYKNAILLGKETPYCLDVACGAKPFPKAHVLCDLYIRKVQDRRMQELVTEGKPFVLCDCHILPFKDKAFDFVTSYYLIEHISCPSKVLRELERVSIHGYIQCPSWLNEVLYGEEVHKWIIIKRNNRLYVRPINFRKRFKIQFGFIFHRLYRSNKWRVVHAILDETLHLFTVNYTF